MPFASPPVDELRWQKPVVPEAWDGVKNTKSFGRKCVQAGELFSSENCLFLNVYIPGSVKENV